MRSRVAALVLILPVLALAVLIPGGAPTTAAAAAPRPHVVYILADDLGWKDVGFHGSDIKTPNLDQLAADGARLEQFYAQPMCTPSRALAVTAWPSEPTTSTLPLAGTR